MGIEYKSPNQRDKPKDTRREFEEPLAKWLSTPWAFPLDPFQQGQGKNNSSQTND
jgi:hypothetical protein